MQNLLQAATKQVNSNSSTTSTSSTSSSSSKLLGSANVHNQNLNEELSSSGGASNLANGVTSSSKSIRSSLKLAKLNSNLNASMLINASPSHETGNRYSTDQFHQQIADLQSNLKSVKSLTNLYESKQLSVSPPNTSPHAISTQNT